MISSLQNEKIKFLSSLNNKKNRDISKSFIVEGYHLVEEAYKNSNLKLVIYNGEIEFKYEGVEYLEVDKKIIEKISETKSPQNILGLCSYLKEINYQDLLYYHRVVLLDNVQDPGNVGTIVRNCLAFGIDLVVFCNNSVDIYNSKFVRASQGYLFKMPLCKLDLKDTLQVYKDHNYEILTTYLGNDSKEIGELNSKDNFVLILGNEGNGVSEISLKMATQKIIIEMLNNVESLNVGVASGIVLYNLMKNGNFDKK